MKKAIFAIATLAILTVGNSFAQKGFPPKEHNGPAVSARYDNRIEEYNINKLDKMVGLTRKQENKIRKIENAYDKMADRGRGTQSWQGQKRLEEQKQREIFSVLTPNQRQKLMAYEHAGKFDIRGRFNRRG
ncbi:hypothetical protein [Dyadobacter sp. NIV53]|uniref:hypothetical protein n=1 Tax=Dyadobacter sp. NIV53 TaxID=2861765 RepID=UPI001C88CADA|nr:hypothetical protein [Dyadobacter sp. NIV53]